MNYLQDAARSPDARSIYASGRRPRQAHVQLGEAAQVLSSRRGRIQRGASRPDHRLLGHRRRHELRRLKNKNVIMNGIVPVDGYMQYFI